MTDLGQVIEALPAECHLRDTTSARESGIGFRFTGSPGVFYLFATDTDAFRRALAIDGRCCDHALLWRRVESADSHCTAVELKGGSLSRAVSQLEALLTTLRRHLRSRGVEALRESAIVVFRGRLLSHQLQKYQKALRRAGITLRVATVKSGQTADLRPILKQIEPESP